MTTRFAAIHQFHSGTAPGDAITNQMFGLQAEFRALGYVSEIYAEHIEYDVAMSVRHIDGFVPSPNELLLVHHSMGHRRLDPIIELPNPIVTVYHNITPAQELDNASYKHFSHVGRYQLDVLATRSLFGIADSNYNRLEMLQRGFRNVEVIPVRTNFREFLSIRETRNPERDWLFVGRIAPNKQQLEIVRAFHHFHHSHDKSARMFLVGDHKMRSYVDLVGDEIENLGLINQIDVTGKLDDVELINRYARAGVFISLSRHEGFGVPLLEAMAAGVPVIALESSAVTETMGGAGVLLQSPDPVEVSNAVHRVMTDDAYRNEILWRQDRRLEKLTGFDVRSAIKRVLSQIDGMSFPLRIQVQGPIESSYSLAILNREVAFQLNSDSTFETSVYPTEGPGDYPPNVEAMSSIEGLTGLYEHGKNTPYPDVVIRQMFPPRVKDTTAATTLQYFGWEESLVPSEYATDFNKHLHRVMTMSTFVKDALRSSGVTIPIDVVGVGVSTPQADSSALIGELQNVRKVKFLHISSAFPRKGIDALLNAYFSRFTGDDDATLILKTFPNQHNSVGELLETLQSQHPNPPHVAWINRDLSTGYLGFLYSKASAYVHPARGEGFGLPVAEAMLAEVPVISTNTSGLADFVDSSTAAVVPSQLVSANSHVSIPGSEWYEPDVQVLGDEMRSLYEGHNPDVRASRVSAAKARISENFSWEAVGNRVKKSVLAARAEPTSLKVTHLTTFNSRCGIAEYSALYQAALPRNILSRVIADKNVWPLDLEVEEDVTRLWNQIRHQDLSQLATALQLSNSDIIHLQYNYGFFAMEDLSELINRLGKTKPFIITLHRTKDLDRGHEIVSLAHAADALKKVAAIVVHEEHDIARLASFGIEDNVVHIPHAAMPFSGIKSQRKWSPEQELRIGTFGFLLPHKGLEVSIRALEILNSQGVNSSLTALCSLHPDPTSATAHSNVLELMTKSAYASSIHLDTEYHTVEEIHSLLSDVDVLVLPYSPTEESSSGVLAMLLGIGKPIIATELEIFEGANDAFLNLKSPASPEELAARIVELTSSPSLMREMGRKAARRAIDISWGAIGRESFNLYRSVLGR